MITILAFMELHQWFVIASLIYLYGSIGYVTFESFYEDTFVMLSEKKRFYLSLLMGVLSPFVLVVAYSTLFITKLYNLVNNKSN